MKELTFAVPGISCQHCVNAITKETQAVGVQTVQVDIPSKTVFVAFDETTLSAEQVKEAIEEAGYDVAGQQEGQQIPAPSRLSLNMKPL